MSYGYLPRSLSECVHFRYADDLDASDQDIRDALKKSGVICGYVDYLQARGDEALREAIAKALKLENAPYGPRTSPYQPVLWVPFSDDLAGLSYDVNGAAIIIDNAHRLLAEDSRTMFSLIEYFLASFKHWFEQKKPYHLYFQMEPNEWVRRIFGAE